MKHLALGGVYPDLSGPTTKKKHFLCVSSLTVGLFTFFGGTGGEIYVYVNFFWCELLSSG